MVVGSHSFSKTVIRSEIVLWVVSCNCPSQNVPHMFYCSIVSFSDRKTTMHRFLTDNSCPPPHVLILLSYTTKSKNMWIGYLLRERIWRVLEEIYWVLVLVVIVGLTYNSPKSWKFGLWRGDLDSTGPHGPIRRPPAIEWVLRMVELWENGWGVMKSVFGWHVPANLWYSVWVQPLSIVYQTESLRRTGSIWLKSWKTGNPGTQCESKDELGMWW